MEKSIQQKNQKPLWYVFTQVASQFRTTKHRKLSNREFNDPKKNWNDCLVLENEDSAEAIVRLHKYIKITDTPHQITLLLNDIINNPQKYPL